MTGNRRFVPVGVASVALAAVVGSMAIADPAKEAKPADQPETKLPEGWTEEDMQACMQAGMPGEMHAYLAKRAGVWQGKGQMWMGPDTEPVPYECSQTVAIVMDGRFLTCDYVGEVPGMGPFHGIGYHGFDNVTQQFVSTWIDNYGTGIMTGTGERSSDGRTLTWTCTFNCPVTKRPAKMRQIEKISGEDTMTLDIYMADPKSGRDYRMLSLNFSRTQEK